MSSETSSVKGKGKGKGKAKGSNARDLTRPSWPEAWGNEWLGARSWRVATMYDPRYAPSCEEDEPECLMAMWADFRMTREGKLWLDHRLAVAPTVLPCNCKMISAEGRDALEPQGKLMCMPSPMGPGYLQALPEHRVETVDGSWLDGFALGGLVSTGTTLEDFQREDAEWVATHTAEEKPPRGMPAVEAGAPRRYGEARWLTLEQDEAERWENHFRKEWGLEINGRMWLVLQRPLEGKQEVRLDPVPFTHADFQEDSASVSSVGAASVTGSAPIADAAPVTMVSEPNAAWRQHMEDVLARERAERQAEVERERAERQADLERERARMINERMDLARERAEMRAASEQQQAMLASILARLDAANSTNP